MEQMSRVLPVLFNTDMVRAILDDRKTATRRLIKFLPEKNPKWTGYVKDGLMLYNGRNEPCCRKPPYEVGDILYVREAWSTRQSNTCMGNTTAGCPYDSCETASGPCFENEYIYKATDSLDPYGSSIRKWHPSIHMPKEAARIWLKVTDVRVERLQDMKLSDFLDEGVVIREESFNDPENAFGQARTAFKNIWDSTIKKSDLDMYGWAANPWVWVIEFERCEKPEDL